MENQPNNKQENSMDFLDNYNTYADMDVDTLKKEIALSDERIRTIGDLQKGIKDDNPSDFAKFKLLNQKKTEEVAKQEAMKMVLSNKEQGARTHLEIDDKTAEQLERASNY